jgi:hypothetical protein
VRFTTVTGRVITTTVTDAFPSEFSGSGRSRTIDLRYGRNDPAQPSKQSNYMPASTFIGLLAFGAVLLLLGYWGLRAPAGLPIGPYETDSHVSATYEHGFGCRRPNRGAERSDRRDTIGGARRCRLAPERRVFARLDPRAGGTA